MKIKSDRKSLIVSLIRKMQIRTQEELASALTQNGLEVTQATLSRDMREIGAVKGVDGFYVIPSSSTSGMGFLLKAECSGQMCVVHTKPGFAPAFASVIDASDLDGVMGTIAGDDTVLVILREGAKKSEIVEKIKHLP